MLSASRGRLTRTGLVFAIIVIALGGVLTFTYITQSNTISSQSKKITDLNSSMAFANSTIAADSRQISTDTALITRLQSQMESANSTIESLQAKVQADLSQIRSLNASNNANAAQVATLEGQVSQYQSQVQSLQTQISALQAQVSTLTAQVNSLKAAFVAGTLTYTSNCGGGSGSCSYQITGLFANYGVNDAHNTTASFIFYSGASPGEGQVLCTTTVALGTVLGHTVHTFPTTNCDSMSNVVAGAMATQFNWS